MQAINETIGKELEWVGEPVDFSAPVEEKKSRRRSTRGQKDKNRSRKSKAEAQEAPVQEADSVPAGLEEQPMVPMHTERRAPTRARGGRRANQPKDEAIFRNASHIPAFLLRETRSKVQSR